MPYFDVDVEKIDYGIIRIKATNGKEAMRKILEEQPTIEEDRLFTGTALKPVGYTESYE